MQDGVPVIWLILLVYLHFSRMAPKPAREPEIVAKIFLLGVLFSPRRSGASVVLPDPGGPFALAFDDALGAELRLKCNGMGIEHDFVEGPTLFDAAI
jgi:hypothetical protein